MMADGGDSWAGRKMGREEEGGGSKLLAQSEIGGRKMGGQSHGGGGTCDTPPLTLNPPPELIVPWINDRF